MKVDQLEGRFNYCAEMTSAKKNKKYLIKSTI